MLFTVWGRISVVSGAFMTIVKFTQAFGAKDGDERQSAALGFLVSGMTTWWAWTALQLAR